MLDEPTPTELLEALAAFLRYEVMPLVEGSARFRSLVAANVAGIVARQIERGDEIERNELDALRVLLGETSERSGEDERVSELDRLNRELVSRIEEGGADADPRRTLIRAHLRRVVADKLAVDNPKLLSKKR